MNYFTVTLDQFNTSSLNKSNDICLAFIAKQYLTTVSFPVAQLVELGASNAKIMGSIPRESKS